MWILTGPFDGPEGKTDFEKQRLLRPGTTYTLARKNQELILNNKKVSKDHATIIVGEYSTEDVQDPSIRPSVIILHKREKAMGFERNGESVAIGASTPVELQDGDVLCPVSSIRLKLEWRTLCCYSNKASSAVLSACASRGVNLVQTFQPDITHHVTQTLCLDTSVALSLISKCPLVTPAWLAEVNRLDGLGQGNPAPDFKLPPESQFKPPLDPSLSTSLKSSHLWKFDSKRLSTLSEHRFIILAYKEEETVSMIELLRAAGATSSIFYVNAGKSTFRRHLSKNKDEKSLVILTHDSVKATITEEQWEELQEEAKNFDRHFSPRERVLEAIISMNASLLSDSDVHAPTRSRSPSVLPDIVPNTLIDEPTFPLEQSKPKLKRLVKRTMPPATPPPPPPIEVEDSPPPPPRKVLTRRAGSKPAFMMLDDSISLDTESITPAVEQSMPPPSSTKPILGIDYDAPLPQRSSRLKRRAGTAGFNTATDSAPDKSEVITEPPLKKFKALFEESDPDRLSQMETNTTMDTEIQHTPTFHSLPTSHTQANGGPSGLHVVQEEEESTLSAAQENVGSRGLKRKSERIEENEESGTQPGPKPKKRALEGSGVTQQSAAAVESPRKKPRQAAPEESQAAPGSQIGQPDVDNKFLKALASMKKGKKNEDTFDREFNNLRISKPELERDDHEKEWNLLEDFGDESNIRGNFMVVVEMEVYRKDGNQPRLRRGTGRPEWEGKPDFKKFRKKHNFEQRSIIELTVSEEKDYGMGSAYWKGNPEHRSQEEADDQYFPSKSQTQSKSKPILLPSEDSDDEGDEFPVRQTGKRGTQSQKPTRARGKTPRAKKEETKPQPLFLSDDEEMAVDEDDEIDELDEDTPTLRSSRSSKTQKSQPARKAAPAAIVIDDDSDDGTAFKGFGARAKGRSRR